MFLSRSICLLACAAALVANAAQRATAAEAAARAAAMHSITSDELKQVVDALADDTFEGREAGSRGSRAASGYIVDRLKKLGIAGGGPGGSYYQPFGAYRNILGLVEGSDPQLKDQVIVVGAHYDHVGYGTNRNSYGPIGRIHNGADDNASGVAALVEVADAVAHLPEHPKRSILFAFWDGEEKGLLGSQHWVDNPTVAIKRVAMAVNVDMIGRLRNSRLEIFGVRTSPGLRRLVSTQNSEPGLRLDYNWDVRPDSDHQSFYARSIPFVMMHTGKHSDYHRPSDDAEKINNDGLAKISRLMFNVVVEMADRPTLGEFRAAARSESQGVQWTLNSALPAAPGRLGVRWDEDEEQRTGAIVVATVAPGSAAALAGVRAGDKFVRFDGRDVQGGSQFRIAVLAAKNPVSATLERPGNPPPLEVSLALAGQPVRLGISWRTDNAEPGAVIVNRVTPGSPADLAGIRVGDRIYRIGASDFADGEAFRQMATSSAGPITLEIETGGLVRTIEIPAVDDAPKGAPADANDNEREDS